MVFVGKLIALKGWWLSHRQHISLKLMGLLAFLRASMFGMVASRFDNRKQVVIQEANAIGTAYLRTSFLPVSSRTETQQLLHKYTALRRRPEHHHE